MIFVRSPGRCSTWHPSVRTGLVISRDQWGIVGSQEEDPGGTVPAHPIRSRAPAIDMTGHCNGDPDPLAEVGFASLPSPVTLPAFPGRALSGEVTMTRTRLGTWGGPSLRVAHPHKSLGALLLGTFVPSPSFIHLLTYLCQRGLVCPHLAGWVTVQCPITHSALQSSQLCLGSAPAKSSQRGQKQSQLRSTYKGMLRMMSEPCVGAHVCSASLRAV